MNESFKAFQKASSDIFADIVVVSVGGLQRVGSRFFGFEPSFIGRFNG